MLPDKEFYFFHKTFYSSKRGIEKIKNLPEEGVYGTIQYPYRLLLESSRIGIEKQR